MDAVIASGAKRAEGEEVKPMAHRLYGAAWAPTRILPLLMAGMLAILSTPAYAAVCMARSAATRATVIELYTSEGCSSCPPADRWLSGFVGRPGSPSPIIPLAFHVDYWDYIGWQDRFASPQNTARQNERVGSNRGSFAYTPQTFVDGRDSSVWRQARSPGELPLSTALVPGADLALRVETTSAGRIAVELDTKLSHPGDAGHAVAYIALYENGLSSEVRAGENAGHQLHHDFVVREWVGPFPVSDKKSGYVFSRSDVVFENAGVAAVVELADGSRLLQAVSEPLCR